MKKIKDIIEQKKGWPLQKKRKQNPIHVIADTFYQLKRWDTYPKEHYQRLKKLHYGRHAKDAKLLYEYCGKNLDLALKILYQMASEAKANNMEWVISTIFKRWKTQKHGTYAAHSHKRK